MVSNYPALAGDYNYAESLSGAEYVSNYPALAGDYNDSGDHNPTTDVSNYPALAGDYNFNGQPLRLRSGKQIPRFSGGL